MGKGAEWTCCWKQKCSGWQYNKQLEKQPWCPKCWAKLQPTPTKPAKGGDKKGDGKKSGQWDGGGKGKGNGSLALALSDLTSQLSSLEVAEAANLGKQFENFVKIVKDAEDKKAREPEKSRTQRFREAATKLDHANGQYEKVFKQVQKQQAYLDELRDSLEEKAQAVYEAEEACERIQNEGKEDNKNLGVIEQLLRKTPEELLGAETKGAEVSYDDLTEEGQKKIEAGKLKMVAELKKGAEQFQSSLKEHLEKVRTEMEQEQKTIRQAHKKRKQDDEAATVKEKPQEAKEATAAAEPPEATPTGGSSDDHLKKGAADYLKQHRESAKAKAAAAPK